MALSVVAALFNRRELSVGRMPIGGDVARFLEPGALQRPDCRCNAGMATAAILEWLAGMGDAA